MNQKIHTCRCVKYCLGSLIARPWAKRKKQSEIQNSFHINNNYCYQFEIAIPVSIALVFLYVIISIFVIWPLIAFFATDKNAHVERIAGGIYGDANYT